MQVEGEIQGQGKELWVQRCRSCKKGFWTEEYSKDKCREGSIQDHGRDKGEKDLDIQKCIFRVPRNKVEREESNDYVVVQKQSRNGPFLDWAEKEEKGWEGGLSRNK